MRAERRQRRAARVLDRPTDVGFLTTRRLERSVREIRENLEHIHSKTQVDESFPKTDGLVEKFVPNGA